MSPPCEDFLTADRLAEPERYYPLDVRICGACLLVQLPAYIAPEDIFGEYFYFSSYSDSWVDHARRYRRGRSSSGSALGPSSRVIEVASNDGYLLRHVIARGIPVLGIEPARNIAAAAEAAGVPTLAEFLTTGLAQDVVKRDGPADLVVANNVFAHVPDLNDFTAALGILLAPRGVLTIEVAHLVRLVEQQPVRYDLPRALHVLHAADRGTGPRPPWTARLRRRGARHARGLASVLRRPR